jgi:hypothetical protein
MMIHVSNELYKWIEEHKGNGSRDAALRVAVGLPAYVRAKKEVVHGQQGRPPGAVYVSIAALQVGQQVKFPYLREEGLVVDARVVRAMRKLNREKGYEFYRFDAGTSIDVFRRT